MQQSIQHYTWRERGSVQKRGTWPSCSIVQCSSFDSLFSQKCSCGAGMIICLLIALQRHIWLNVYKNNLLTAPRKFFSWRGKQPPTFSVEYITFFPLFFLFAQQLVRISMDRGREHFYLNERCAKWGKVTSFTIFNKKGKQTFINLTSAKLIHVDVNVHLLFQFSLLWLFHLGYHVKVKI